MKKNYKLFTAGLITATVQLNAQCPTPTSVTATPSVICAGATTSLNATAVGSSINWYTVAVGGVPLGSSLSGANYSVNPVNTTTYYVESFITGTNTLVYTGSVQQYTVPAGVNQLTITAIGAKGGSVVANSGGLGTSMKGTFTVIPGSVLTVVVGGEGNAAPVSSGGGGASGVASGITPLIVAGGGAGINGSNSYPGTHAVITPSGVVGQGTGGAGGIGGADGGDYTYVGNGNNTSRGGRGFNFNNAGSFGNNGSSVNTTTTAGTWGLGGGGGSVGASYCNCGGGGGGYSGGGSANINACGGGGGSYNSGTNQVNLTMAGTGNGTVIIVASSCVSASRTAVSVTVSPSPTISVNSGSVCSGNSFTMVPSGANTYTFQGGNAVVSPTANTNYTVIGTSTAGCVSQSAATSSVTINASPLPTISVNSGSLCSGNSFTMVPSGANTYTFQGGNAVVSPTANASYTVVGTSSAGCVSQSFATSSVTVAALPSLTVTGAGTICAGGQTATLTVSGANSYSWNTGSTSASIAVTPTATATYTANGTSSVTGCTGIITAVVTVDPCTGLANNTSAFSGLSIYPNPSNGEFTVELKNGSVKTIEVTDYTGKVVFTSTSSKDIINVNLSSLATGIYNVKIQSNNTTEVLKVVKQ